MKGEIALTQGTREGVTEQGLLRDIYPVLSDRIRSFLTRIPNEHLLDTEEIRLRAERPIMVNEGGEDYFINAAGKQKNMCAGCMIIERLDIERTLQYMSDYSIYTLEDELRQGFLTLKGGHRVGLVGRVVPEHQGIRTIKNISGMNIRIAREVKDCALELSLELYGQGIKHTLIASPPGCGKTTMLRDMVRLLSYGIGGTCIKGYKVGVVDERSEIGGCYLGIPQRDLGPRTDVLDACPKAAGIGLLIRSMGPDVIAVDEIGSLKDSEAVEEAIYSGVTILATAHGSNMDELLKKPGISNLMEKKAFERIVILSRARGPGTVASILKLD